MKRYLVFAGDDYYPNGGWGDFCCSYETEEDAINHLRIFIDSSNIWQVGQDVWGEVVDLEKEKVIAKINCYGKLEYVDE